jgi:hypothetical protein
MSTESSLADKLEKGLGCLQGPAVAAAAKEYSDTKERLLVQCLARVASDFLEWVRSRAYSGARTFGTEVSIFRTVSSFQVNCQGEFARSALPALRDRIAEVLADIPHRLQVQDVTDPREFGECALVVHLL